MADIYRGNNKEHINNANLFDPTVALAAGIDPKTGLPIKYIEGSQLKANIKKALRIKDEQQAIGRYKWENLPNGLDGQLLERILYYRGQAMFFKLQDKYFFLPYALDGTIDVYSRYTGCTPVPFNGTASADKDGKQKPWITGLVRKPVYYKEDEDKDEENSCVLLHDYCKQVSQTVLPRQSINDPLLDVMADCIPFMRTSLQNETGIQGMRVNTQDEYSNVMAANATVNKAALEGQKYVAIVGNVEFQDLTTSAPGTSQDFMQALEALDNFRLSLYGINNGGVFAKKAHMLQDEQDMAGGSDGLVYNDGLYLRQQFCDIVNAIWGLGINVSENEDAIAQPEQMSDTDETEDFGGTNDEQ